MRAISQAGEGDWRVNRGFGAPGKIGVQTPFIMGIAGAIGPAGAGYAPAAAIDANRQSGSRLLSGAQGFTGDAGAMRDNPAFVAPVGPGSPSGGIRLETEPIPHDLRLGPISEVRFRKLREVFQERVGDRVAAAGTGVSHGQNIIGVSDDGVGDVAGEGLDIVNDVALKIDAGALGGTSVGEDDDGAG